MVEISKEALQKLKVAELREVLKDMGGTPDGLKKAELIDAIIELDSQEVIEEEVVEEVQPEPEPEPETEIEPEPEPEPEPEIEVIAEEVTSESEITYAYLAHPAIIYQDETCTKFLDKISGHVKVIEETDKFKKISLFKSGRGYLYGYVKK